MGSSLDELYTGGTTDLDQTRTQNKVNEIVTIGASIGTNWADPLYDAAGNMTTMPKPSSLANSYTATYDPWNRMLEVKDGASVVVDYLYDGRNRRISAETATTRNFFYTNTWQDIEERIGNTTVDRTYVWGIRYIDELVCRDDATPQRLYVTQDANFNVTALINTSATVVERYTYTAYGVETFCNASWVDIGSSAYGSTILYAGYQYDAETGVYFVRMRYLHSHLGTWNERDVFEESNLSLYDYSTGNPIGFLDPHGAIPEPATLILILGTVLGAIKQPTLKIVQEGIDREFCCTFLWLIHFELANKYKSRGGFVIQHLRVTINTRRTCKTGKDPIDPELCTEQQPFTLEYWEAFEIKKGATKTETDQYKFDGCGRCTIGGITFDGKAVLYEIPLPKGFVKNNEALKRYRNWPGGLPTSAVDPRLTGGTPPIQHMIKATWDCHQGLRRRTETPASNPKVEDKPIRH